MADNFFPVQDMLPHVVKPAVDGMAYCLVKSCPTGDFSFADIMRAGFAPLNFGEPQTVLVLPSDQIQLLGASGQAMAKLRAILSAEAQLLDIHQRRIWRLRIDPLAAMSKLGELGFSASQFGINANDGVHTWTLVYRLNAPTTAVNAGIRSNESLVHCQAQPGIAENAVAVETAADLSSQKRLRPIRTTSTSAINLVNNAAPLNFSGISCSDAFNSAVHEKAQAFNMYGINDSYGQNFQQKVEEALQQQLNCSIINATRPNAISALNIMNGNNANQSSSSSLHLPNNNNPKDLSTPTSKRRISNALVQSMSMALVPEYQDQNHIFHADSVAQQHQPAKLYSSPRLPSPVNRTAVDAINEAAVNAGTIAPPPPQKPTRRRRSLQKKKAGGGGRGGKRRKPNLRRNRPLATSAELHTNYLPLSLTSPTDEPGPFLLGIKDFLTQHPEFGLRPHWFSCGALADPRWVGYFKCVNEAKRLAGMRKPKNARSKAVKVSKQSSGSSVCEEDEDESGGRKREPLRCLARIAVQRDKSTNQVHVFYERIVHDCGLVIGCIEGGGSSSNHLEDAGTLKIAVASPPEVEQQQEVSGMVSSSAPLVSSSSASSSSSSSTSSSRITAAERLKMGNSFTNIEQISSAAVPAVSSVPTVTSTNTKYVSLVAHRD